MRRAIPAAILVTGCSVVHVVPEGVICVDCLQPASN